MQPSVPEDSRVGNYVVISPVKDEGAYIERTILSVVHQSLRPRRWIVVDDGSSDNTPEILTQYSQQYHWITVLRRARDKRRRPGSAVIAAFDAGHRRIEDRNLDFVVKLDCDLEVPSDYFERLVHKFEADPKLGIASGIYMEASGKAWRPVKMPEYHAAGCSKMVRSECFRQIGGFIPQRGWDTVDEIRAQMMGWKTCHFKDLQLRHLKSEGAGIGAQQTNLMHGQIYYLTGGGIAFFLLKVLHRSLTAMPPLLGGLMMFVGFMQACLKRAPRLVNEKEARQYRQLLNSRVYAAVLRCRGTTGKAR